MKTDGRTIGNYGRVISALLIFASAPHAQATLADQKSTDKAKGELPATVQVKGKVVDRDGKGMPNVEVSFTGSSALKTTTDSEGSFSQKAAPGKYKVTAKFGSKSKTTEVDLKYDTSELVLVLE